MRRVLGVLALSLVLVAPAQAGIGSPATLSCPKLATAPTIDGIVGEAEWADAAALSPFVVLGGKRMPSHTTEVFIGYDDNSLYIGARLFDPTPNQIQCAATQRDGPVYRDDSFEVLLDPDHEGEHYIHLAVNAAGTQYDAVDDVVEHDEAWVAKTSRGETGWNVEIAFGFGEGNYPAEGKTWGMTMCRHVPRIVERSAWTALEWKFTEPANFGTMVFDGPPLRCELAPVENVWFGSNSAEVTVTNLSEKEEVVKVNLRVTGPTRRAHFFTMEKLENMKPGEKRGLTMGFRVARGGACKVQVSAQVIEGKKALPAFCSAAMPFELPAVGAALDEALSAISACFRTYSQLAPENRPTGSEESLDSIAARWRLYDREYRRRAEYSPDRLLEIMKRLSQLRDEATTLNDQLGACAGP